MSRPGFLFIAALTATLSILCRLSAQPDPESPRRHGGNGRVGRGEIKMPTPAFRTKVPAHPVDLILGRPTKTAITLSVLAYADTEGYIAYGTQRGRYPCETAKQRFAMGEPVELHIARLEPNTRYHYQFRSRATNNAAFSGIAEGTFTTARPPGSTFTFTVQADPHLDYGIDPEIYKKSLTNAVAAQPDFHLDLGDTFMTDKYTDFKLAAPQYLAQRYYFGIVGSHAPVSSINSCRSRATRASTIPAAPPNTAT